MHEQAIFKGNKTLDECRFHNKRMIVTMVVVDEVFDSVGAEIKAVRSNGQRIRRERRHFYKHQEFSGTVPWD